MTAKSKKIVLGIAAVFAALIVLVVILGATAPKDMHVEQSIVINKPIGQVFAYLRDLKNGEQWGPWYKMDPNMTLEYHGQDGAVGSWVSWSGNHDVGVGEQEIKAIDPNKRIDYELRFKKPMEGVSTSYFTTSADGPTSPTTVVWGMDSNDMPFMARAVSRIINCKAMMEKTFAEGLTDLKAKLESQ
ncbi:MAG TPA: SRPBCC family protein [Alphaproteobacteria bacterium]